MPDTLDMGKHLGLDADGEEEQRHIARLNHINREIIILLGTTLRIEQVETYNLYRLPRMVQAVEAVTGICGLVRTGDGFSFLLDIDGFGLLKKAK